MKFRILLLFFFYLVSVILFANDSTDLNFVFSDSGPPYSYLSDSSNLEGITPDLVQEVIDLTIDMSAIFEAYPWKRAQYLVKNSLKDAFCTYPSESRKEYAIFTNYPLYYQEYGYLIFSKNNKRAQDLLDINNVDELNDFVFISQSGIAWEEDNIPETVERIYVTTPEQLLNVTLGRESGDFFIMNLEQAIYYSKKLGYENKIMYNRVNFIPESSIPFHIGIRNNFPEGRELISLLDKIILSTEFINNKEKIMGKYR